MDRQPEPVLREESPAEYFKGLVVASLARRQVQANDLTEFYLVNLLCRYIRTDQAIGAEDSEPLAVRLIRALQTGGLEQRTRLRRLGDCSLFIAGFFPDSLNRRAVDVDYYTSMGAYAYGTLSRAEDALRDVFAELAQKFVGFSDVLADVSEQAALAPRTHDLLRSYEKWLRTGSEREGQRLIHHGIVPNRSVEKRFLQ